ncbi:MAG TPA: DUF5658 family protein [Burkholderiales bacterium]|nr:DUF5658 family protein [Burkholderiales bacterium]
MDLTLLLVAVTVILQVADGITTWLIIRRGVGHESNRLVRVLMDWFGLEAALFLVKGWVVVLVLGGYFLELWHGQGAQVALFVLELFYVGVVVNNMNVLHGED